MISWDDTFMELVYVIAKRSHDPRTHIGAIVAAPDNTIRSMGYNGLPRGIQRTPTLTTAPEKYKWMCHAEENAILNAGRSSASLIGCRLYVNLLPCNTCARAILQAGISEVIVHAEGQNFYEETSNKSGHHWTDAFKCTNSMLSESGITIRYLDYQLLTSIGLFNGNKFPHQP